MLKQVSAKPILYSFLILVLLWGCGPTGGGNAYRSEVYDRQDSRYRGGIEVSSDGRSIRIYGNLYCYGNYQWHTGQWVNIQNGGVSEFTRRCNNWWATYGLEISGGRLRIYYKHSQNPSGFYGGWIPLCPRGGGISTSAGSFRVETNNANNIRFCYYDYYNGGRWVCGNWVSYSCGPSCPSGYTYNPSRKICEADPIYSYSCPAGDYQCVESSPGVAYCSPYNCAQQVNGKAYCMSGPIPSGISANVIGMWWCSGDGTWLTSESECIKNCPYYTCEMDGQVYTGFDTCELNCREVYSCEVF